MILFTMLMYVNGGLEPHWVFFGGSEPMFYFPMVMHVNGGLEPHWGYFGGFEPCFISQW